MKPWLIVFFGITRGSDMSAGRYRHRIEIQELRYGKPDPVTGHSEKGWHPLFSKVPAEVLTGPGREPFAAGTIQAETTARINFRWFSIKDTDLMKCRILWDGNIYDIQSVDRDRTGRVEWRTRCKDGLSDG